jgi:hypothetical protein
MDLAAFENFIAGDIASFESWMSGGSNPRNQVMKQIQSAESESIADELNYCDAIWKTWMNAANLDSVATKRTG